MRLAPHRMFVRSDLHDAGAHRGRCRATNAQSVQIILGLAINTDTLVYVEASIIE